MKTNIEITSLVYDTLMQNTIHETFDLNDIEKPEVSPTQGYISFNYKGQEVTLHVSSVPIV